MMRVLRRLALAVPTLWLALSMVYALVLLVPGDPAVTIAGDNPAPGQVERIRAQLGLDDNALARYAKMFGHLFTGDLGTSLFSSQTVVSAVTTRIPLTIALTLLAIVAALAVGVPLGLIAGARAGRPADRAINVVATLGMALPSFWLGLLLVIGLSLKLGWLPATGYAPFADGLWPWLSHLILPAVTLALAPAAEITRQLRASMRDVLRQDYIRTAWSRGLPGRVVVARHALRNSLIPVLTVAGVQTIHLLGGVVVVEAVFGLPGLGSLAVQSVVAKDLPVIQGVVIFGVLTAMAVNLIVDIAYGFADPKVRAA
ncbi:ABC transporter permease [Spirillospora sp. CA-255316]